jgi:hypothetical protein
MRTMGSFPVLSTGVSVQSRLEEKTGRQSISASLGDSTMTKSREK